MLIEATSFVVARITRADRSAILACSILKPPTGPVRQHRNSGVPDPIILRVRPRDDLGDSRCPYIFWIGFHHKEAPLRRDFFFWARLSSALGQRHDAHGGPYPETRGGDARR